MSATTGHMRKATAILQGRTGSTRLPGKVLLPLAGKPVMQQVYERIRYCRNIDSILVATSTAEEDDSIFELFTRLGVPVFRGSKEDPLDRYYRAASHYGLRHIVRIMADCPLVDPAIVDQVIALYFSGGYEFCCLGGEFPTGLDTTVFSYSALARCWREGLRRSEREHITAYLSHHPEQFNIGVLERHQGLSHHRWVMDYEADYQFITKIYEALYVPGQLFASAEILELVQEQPQLLRINAEIPRDEGYLKALAQEQAEARPAATE